MGKQRRRRHDSPTLYNSSWRNDFVLWVHRLAHGWTEAAQTQTPRFPGMEALDEDFTLNAMRKNKAAGNIIGKLHRLGFTNVSKVKDANEPIWVEVTKADSNAGRKKDASECALARACVREKHADGAVINIGTSYIIKGDTATRFKTSAGVGREITSFDRGAGFEQGNDYLLSAIPPACRLDAPARPSNGTAGPKLAQAKRPNVHRHHTENIRVSRALPKKK